MRSTIFMASPPRSYPVALPLGRADRTTRASILGRHLPRNQHSDFKLAVVLKGLRLPYGFLAASIHELSRGLAFPEDRKAREAREETGAHQRPRKPPASISVVRDLSMWTAQSPDRGRRRQRLAPGEI